LVKCNTPETITLRKMSDPRIVVVFGQKSLETLDLDNCILTFFVLTLWPIENCAMAHRFKNTELLQLVSVTQER